MTVTTVRFESAALGVWSEPDPFAVTRERLIA